jgi:hypothetical protein
MSVKRTHVGGKIFLQEDPSLTGLRARDFAGSGFGQHRSAVHLQKCGGLFNRHRTDE